MKRALKEKYDQINDKSLKIKKLEDELVSKNEKIR